MENKKKVWNGYRKILITMGNKIDVNSLTNLGSILVDKKQGEIEFLKVIEINFNGHIPPDWREGYEIIEKSHNMMIEQGIQSKKEVETAISIEKGILEEAKKIMADAIVLGWGPKPKSSISALVSRIIRKANCDIIVMKQRCNLNQIKNIVYPLAKKPSINRLRLIKKIITNNESELTFLHISEDNPEDKKWGHKLLERANREAAEMGINAKTEMVISSNFLDEITEISKKYELMILGPSGGWWLRKNLFGKKADKIAANAHCSVLLHKSNKD
ncbi:MAG: universal stress protein [Halanaerobiaceae bacterium]